MPPLLPKDASELIVRRAPEWQEHHKRWRFLQDSLEGGNRYRHADYAADPTGITAARGAGGMLGRGIDPLTSETRPSAYGQVVDRNLIPHLSETSEGGWDIYVMRLTRTPVPTTVARAIRRHLARIYSHEVDRKGPAVLDEWW